MEPTVDEIRGLIHQVDSFAAIERIQRAGTPAEIAARYAALVSELYWKAHDLPAVVAIGRAGIIYCLNESAAPGLAADAIDSLRTTAKGLAYDLGSFTWPGWEEPGISPTADDLALGRDCAKLNLRLALELKKPPARLSMAHWLIGAHALAAGDFECAEQQFQTAQQVLPNTDPAAKELEPCNLGYLAIARLGKNSPDSAEHAAAEADFQQITGQLAARKDEDAEVYLSQLLSARRLFVPTAIHEQSRQKIC
jgi:hypothetical protein